MPRFKTSTDILKIVSNKDQIRNIGIIAHVDHGKTTMTDSLLAGAGLLSPNLAGTALAMDFMEEEQKRQMTIKAANVSLLHEEGGTSYVINLIDTPGHVDFSGKVTRSLRAIDGAVVVVDSVEEVMVQTETVTRQALEERVRPVLYINKIDRLIKELKLSPEQIQERIARIIKDFNGLLDLYAEPEFKEKWKVSFASNTVAMGSAKDRWGFNFEVESPPVFRATHCDCVAGEADLPLLLEFGLRVEVKKSVEVFDDPRDSLLDLFGAQFQLLDQTVNLVDVENRPDPFLECLASHGLGLDHDLLDRVNDYYGPIDRSERSGYLSREINVPRGINEINDIGCSSMLVVEADICSLDRHLTLLFLFHEVHSERGPRE